jgi:O-antigen ligase
MLMRVSDHFVASHLPHATANRLAQILSFAGLILVLFVAGLLVLNQVYAFKALDPYYRVTSSGLCLAFGFLTSCLSIRLAIMGCMFALPLLPTIAPNIQLYLGYGRVLGEQAAGLDLVTGMLLGAIINCLLRIKQKKIPFSMPWPAGLVMIILTASVAVAIARNLHQTGSTFLPQALVYNLLHLRSLGWHDDYRPLLDWAAYASACGLMAVFIPALKRSSQRNALVFWPFILSLMISALVGWRQSATGIGLSFDQRNFRVDQFGFVAQGFQPDMHAFGAQLLIGAIGLFGYLYFSKSLTLRLALITLVIPLSWIVLFLSKSRASFGFGVLAIIVIAVVWWFRKSSYLLRALSVICACCIVAFVSLILLYNYWDSTVLLLIQKLGIADFYTFNYKLSYRPEVYRAGFFLFMLFPFFGLGQAEFYRQSANFDLTQSFFLSIQQNGENAHNYFLQILVENGLVGFVAFLILVLYPIFKMRDKRALVPAGVAVLAVFAGNLFSHSMLVRENLLIAAAFLALMYACMQAEQEQGIDVGSSPLSAPIITRNTHSGLKNFSQWIRGSKGRRLTLLITFAFILGGLFAKEVYQSLRSEVFQSDLQCSKFRRLDPDGWTSGLYVVAMPKGSQGVRLSLISTQPDVRLRPLRGTLTLVDHNYDTVLKQDLSLTKNEPQELELRLPAGVLSGRDFRVELKLDRCFIPRNIGMNGDGRRLGVRIESVQWLK